MERKIRRLAIAVVVGAFVGALLIACGQTTIGLMVFAFCAGLAIMGIYRSARSK